MKLKILSEDELVQSVCKEYWEVNNEHRFPTTVSEIKKRYKLSLKELHQILKNYSVASSENPVCNHCEQPYQFINRQDYHSNKNRKATTCRECIESINNKKECRKQKIVEELSQKTLESSKKVNDLQFRDAVYLLALIRHSSSEDLSYIKHLNYEQEELFSPRDTYSNDVVSHLYSSKLIALDPNSPSTIFSVVNDGQLSFDIADAQWLLPINDVYQTPSQFIEELENKLSQPEYWSEDSIRDCILEVSLEECLSYLEYWLCQHKFYFSPGRKTRLVLSKALEHFSVAQIYNFIWRAVKDAAAFYMREQIPKKQAANSVVGNIRRQAENALANSWEVMAYRRNYDIPQSAISRVIFNTLLKTDGEGIKYSLPKLLTLLERGTESEPKKNEQLLYELEAELLQRPSSNDL